MSFRNFASEIYSVGNGAGGSTTLTLLPRMKFNFRVSFVVESTFSNNTYVFERIANVTLPSITFDTQTLNQYNKKRVIQTRMNYGQATFTVYDTHDNDFYDKIIQPYTTHYYNKNNGLDVFADYTGGDQSIVAPEIDTDMGLNLADNRHFIRQIIIEQLGIEGSIRQTTLNNCMLSAVNGDTLDYSESAPVVWQVTVVPENIQVENNL